MLISPYLARDLRLYIDTLKVCQLPPSPKWLTLSHEKSPDTYWGRERERVRVRE